MRRTIGLAVACALLVALAACKRSSGPDWRIVQLYASETSVELLQHPAKVQAFRVDPLPRKLAHGDAHVGPFVAQAAPVDVPAEVAAEISAILADADTYEWQRGAKKEPFRPQVGLQFVRGAYILEIALDLETSQIGVYAGDQPLGHQSFDGVRARLLDLAQRALPKDDALRAMK